MSIHPSIHPSISIYLSIYLYMYIHICKHECMYAWMYVGMLIVIYECMYVRFYVCTFMGRAGSLTTLWAQGEERRVRGISVAQEVFFPTWELAKIRGTLFRGPCNKDPYYLGCYIRVPYFRKLLHPSPENRRTTAAFACCDLGPKRKLAPTVHKANRFRVLVQG